MKAKVKGGSERNIYICIAAIAGDNEHS